MAEKKKYFDENGLLYYDGIVKGRLNNKVDKEFKTGSSSEYKVLSDNNLTDELKQKILDAGTGSFTENDVENILSSKNYATQSWVTQQGYQDEVEVQALINDALEGITGIDFKVVQQLPSTGEKGIIYLVSNSGTDQNIYDEYIWLSDSQSWEKIGTTDIDLSDYIRSEDLIPISNEEIENIVNPQ